MPLKIVAVCITAPTHGALIRLVASMRTNMPLQTVLLCKGVVASIVRALVGLFSVRHKGGKQVISGDARWKRRRNMSKKAKNEIEWRTHIATDNTTYLVCLFICRLMLNRRCVVVLQPGTKHR